MKVITLQPGQVATLSGVIIDCSTGIGDCTCRNRRHRLAAMRQAHAIFSDLPLQKLRNSVPRPLRESQPVKLTELLEGRQICMECVRISLLLQGDFRGESFLRSALDALHPLPGKYSHKK